MTTSTFPYQLMVLPPNIDFDDIRLLKAIAKANKSIGELKGRSMALPNPMLLMSAAMTKESVESSQIEGIHTTVESLLEGEAISEGQLSRENKEALHYKQAMLWGFSNVGKYALSTRLIQGIQSELIEGADGQFRKQQNAIKNNITQEIIYTPPLSKEVPSLMSNWEQFANCDIAKSIDPLIRIALCHYQFEAIHPFSDGNGRTGRILMVLQMVELELIQHPVLYISGFLNRHRANYYNLLRAVTDEQKWTDYLEFMILGFAEQAKKTQEKLIQMEGLYVWLKDNIREKNPKYRAQDLSDHIFSYVLTSPSRLAGSLGVTYQTASRYLSKLEEDKILVSRWFGKQHLYMFPKLLAMIS